jgi:hypothetical protein
MQLLKDRRTALQEILDNLALEPYAPPKRLRLARQKPNFSHPCPDRQVIRFPKFAGKQWLKQVAAPANRQGSMTEESF